MVMPDPAAMVPADEENTVPLDLGEVEEQYEQGYSTTPHGCRVELPEFRCGHGQETWASILGTEP